MFEEMADNDKARFQREKAEYNMNPNGRYKHSRFDIFYSCTNEKFLSKGQNGTRTLQNAPCVGSCTSQQRSVERFVGYKHTFFPKLLIAKKLICLSVQVRQENPNFAVGQIGKELGRRWAEADPEVGC